MDFTLVFVCRKCSPIHAIHKDIENANKTQFFYLFILGLMPNNCAISKFYNNSAIRKFYVSLAHHHVSKIRRVAYYSTPDKMNDS